MTSAPAWASLTAAQQATLLKTPAMSVATGVELLNPDLSVAADLTAWLDVTNADIEWQAGDGNSVHRDCTLTLQTELAWGVALLRVYRVITDLVTGLSARIDRGVFCPQTPSVVADTFVYDETGAQQNEWPVTGQDRTSLLDREVGYTYFVPAGVKVTDALLTAYAEAGLRAGTYLVDASRTDVVPEPGLPFALVPSTDSSDDDTPFSGYIASDPDLAITDTAASGDSVTFRQVINELHALIQYRRVYADDSGYLRSEPYVASTARAPREVPFDVADPFTTVSPGRAITHDLYAAPNQWVGIWTNMPDDDEGVAQVASPANGGVVIVQNIDNGPASYNARGQMWFTKTLQLTALSADDVQTQTQAIADYDQRDVSTMTVSTAPFPAGHFDVLAWLDAFASARGLGSRVQASEWHEPLDAGDIQWVVQFVV